MFDVVEAVAVLAVAEVCVGNWEGGNNTEDITESGNRTPNKFPPINGGIPIGRFEFNKEEDKGFDIGGKGRPVWPGNVGSTDEFGRTEAGAEFILGGGLTVEAGGTFNWADCACVDCACVELAVDWSCFGSCFTVTFYNINNIYLYLYLYNNNNENNYNNKNDNIII